MFLGITAQLGFVLYIGLKGAYHSSFFYIKLHRIKVAKNEYRISNKYLENTKDYFLFLMKHHIIGIDNYTFMKRLSVLKINNLLSYDYPIGG